MTEGDTKHQKVFKKKTKCIVCNKVLKVFERNLCSCKLHVCMKHKLRLLHRCPDDVVAKDLIKVVAPKVVKI